MGLNAEVRRGWKCGGGGGEEGARGRWHPPSPCPPRAWWSTPRSPSSRAGTQSPTGRSHTPSFPGVPLLSPVLTLTRLVIRFSPTAPPQSFAARRASIPRELTCSKRTWLLAFSFILPLDHFCSHPRRRRGGRRGEGEHDACGFRRGVFSGRRAKRGGRRGLASFFCLVFFSRRRAVRTGAAARHEPSSWPCHRPRPWRPWRPSIREL